MWRIPGSGLGQQIVRAEPGEDLPTHMHLAHSSIAPLTSGLSLTSDILHPRGHPLSEPVSADVVLGQLVHPVIQDDFLSPGSCLPTGFQTRAS